MNRLVLYSGLKLPAVVLYASRNSAGTRFDKVDRECSHDDIDPAVELRECPVAHGGRKS